METLCARIQLYKKKQMFVLGFGNIECMLLVYTNIYFKMCTVLFVYKYFCHHINETLIKMGELHESHQFWSYVFMLCRAKKRRSILANFHNTQHTLTIIIMHTICETYGHEYVVHVSFFERPCTLPYVFFFHFTDIFMHSNPTISTIRIWNPFDILELSSLYCTSNIQCTYMYNWYNTNGRNYKFYSSNQIT